MSESTERFRKGMRGRAESSARVTGAIVPPASIPCDLLSSQTSSARNLRGDAAERRRGVLEETRGVMGASERRRQGLIDQQWLEMLLIYMCTHRSSSHICVIFQDRSGSRETGCLIYRSNGRSWWQSWDFGERESCLPHLTVLLFPRGVALIWTRRFELK